MATPDLVRVSGRVSVRDRVRVRVRGRARVRVRVRVTVTVRLARDGGPKPRLGSSSSGTSSSGDMARCSGDMGRLRNSGEAARHPEHVPDRAGRERARVAGRGLG